MRLTCLTTAGGSAAVAPSLPAEQDGAGEGSGGGVVSEHDGRADDDGGMYGVYGEGKPRRIVGDSDDPPRRRPRKMPAVPPADRTTPPENPDR
jgi:hypothetical protein